MTEDQIKIAIKTGKIQLKFWQKVHYYLFVGIFFLMSLLFPILGIVFSMNGLDYSITNFEIGYFIIFLLLGIIVYFNKKRRLKLKVIETNIPKKEINEIVKIVAKQFDWSFRLFRDNIIVAESNPTFTRTGELITIIFIENKILLNSICSPYKRFTPTSFGWNKLNEKTLIYKISNSEI